MVVVSTPVLAHGEGDARALLRDVTAGPYTVSLWDVDGNSAMSMAPHVIVMFDGPMPTSGVTVSVNATPIEVHVSTTTANGWETSQGVAIGDQLTVAISEEGHGWQVGPVIVEPVQAPIPMLKEVILASILVTVRVLWWAARRTGKVWRRPASGATEHATTTLSEGVLQG